jgi:putative transposase
MLKAYKYRIYPNKSQSVMIEKTSGICRLVYNLALETKMRAWQGMQKNLTAFDLIKQIPELITAYPWIGEVDSQAIRWAILSMEKAYASFFRGAGFPKFKKKSNDQSFGCPFNTRKVDFEKGTISIPKIHRIKAVLDRPFEGQIKTITITRTATKKYFASVLVDNKKELPSKCSIRPETTIGIDVGIKSFVVTSDGRSFEPNRYLKNSLARLQCLQRRASKKTKDSNNRKKVNLCVAKLHEKIRNQRVDYCHKITTGLIRDNQAETFVIEDLAVINMLKNRNLSQAIADVSFGEFFRQLQYKCEWYGKNLIKIGRFEPSSKTCSFCGHIKEDLILVDRDWVCENCGTSHDRDLNAARNIKDFGLRQYSGPGRSVEPVESRRLRRTMKQECIISN